MAPLGGVGTTSPLDDGHWHYVVGTVSGSPDSLASSAIYRLYIDGVEVANYLDDHCCGGNTLPWHSGAIGRIGSAPSWGSWYSGDIADLAIYSVALSPAEVAAHYAAAANPMPPPGSVYATGVNENIGSDHVMRLSPLYGGIPATASWDVTLVSGPAISGYGFDCSDGTVFNVTGSSGTTAGVAGHPDCYLYAYKDGGGYQANDVFSGTYSFGLAAPGSPPVPDTSGTYSGSGVWHIVAVAASALAAGATVSGSYDGWVSSNCQNQHKVFYWQVVDAYGSVFASGQGEDGHDDPSLGGHDLEFNGSVSGTAPVDGDWYALQIKVSSSCDFQTDPSLPPMLSIP